MYHLVIRKMKECMECGKTLGIIEGYRHPTMGKDFCLCSKCFDTVFASVEKWRTFISPYIGFFNVQTSTVDNLQTIGQHITTTIKKMQNRVNNLWTHKINQNALTVIR
jgi:hypothetical protein